MVAAAPIVITADEVNCLIHSYLKDSGFVHSAFAVHAEANLDHSPNYKKHVPPGELIELLSKALLYIEVEAHWKADSMTANCKTGFSLLEPHVCSLEAPEPSVSSTRIAFKSNGTIDAASKRKASTPSMEDNRADKRVKRDADDSKAASKPLPTPTLPEAPPSPKKAKPKRTPKAVEDVDEGEPSGFLRGHKREVFNCAWNPTERNLLATGSKDGSISIWNVPTRLNGTATKHDPPIFLFEFPRKDERDITALNWSPDGTLLAVGSYDAKLRVCTSAGDVHFIGTSHIGPIFSAQFSPSGALIATASLDGMTCVWDVKTKKLQKKYDTREDPDCVLDVIWMDDTRFITCGSDGQIHIMKLDEPHPIKVLAGHKADVDVNQVAINPSGTRLASCSDDLTARIWNISKSHLSERSPDSIPGLQSNQPVILKGHTGAICVIRWSSYHPAGTNEIAATSSFDKSVRIWDTVTGECLKIFTEHRRPVYTLSFSPDGLLLATGSGDGFLHVFDMKTLTKKYSWSVGPERTAIYEIVWQQTPAFNRIAMALENYQVAILDISKIPELQSSS